MELIQASKITSTTADTGALNSSYSVENVADDNPGKPFISSGTSETININVSAGTQAIFLFGLMSDSAILTVNDSVGIGQSTELNVTPYSSIDQLNIGTTNLIPPEYLPCTLSPYSGTVLSSPLTTDTTATDSITGAPDTLELQANLTIGDGQTNHQEVVIGLNTDTTVQFNSSGVALNSASATIQLTTSTDRKDSAVSGDNIGYWVQDSGATGRFKASSGASDHININNHGNVRLGSHVTIGGTTYQITKIVGNGTTSGAITLSGSASSATVTQMLNPIKLGMFRMGSVLIISNPQVGAQKSFDDFSYKRALINGGYSQIQRNVVSIYAVGSIMPRSEAENFINHYRAFRSKPFPVLVFDSMPSAQSESVKYSGFFYLPEPPQVSYSFKQAEFQNITFRLREIT